MASRFVGKNDPHFDSSTVTISCDKTGGEIDGAHAISYGDKVTKGSVEILGSRVEVGWTPGGYKADEGKLVMHRAKTSAFLFQLQNANPLAPLSDILCTFNVTYAFLDEEGNPTPAQTDVFQGFVLGRSDNNDRGNTDPLMEELPIKIQGQIQWDGTGGPNLKF